MKALLLFFLPLLAYSSDLERLKEGNSRYINSSTVSREDWSAKRAALVSGQNPFAIIVCCSDSRVPPEIIFDQALGELFVIRIAGNVVDDFAIGSVEYGVKALGAKLLIVLGHKNCGAVDAALKGLKFDNHIQEVLSAIQPSLQPSMSLEEATKANVRAVAEKLKSSKPVLASYVEKGELVVVGGYYDLDTGRVQFLEGAKSGEVSKR